MKYLITGASGFIGSFLVELLLQKKHDVCACGQKFGSIFYNLPGNLLIQEGNIKNADYIYDAIQEYKPDVIIHLAAQSFPNISWESPVHTFEVNVIGTINLLEAVLKTEIKPKIIISSSSSVYASTTTSEPIKENYPLEPDSSPYGVSKLVQEQLGGLYRKRYGMDILFVRPFFLIGPRKEGDVCSEFAKSIVSIEQGNKLSIGVGNLEIIRDFLDVRDGVEALYLISNKGINGKTYNICSGVGYPLRYVLDIFCKQSKHNIFEEKD